MKKTTKSITPKPPGTNYWMNLCVAMVLIFVIQTSLAKILLRRDALEVRVMSDEKAYACYIVREQAPSTVEQLYLVEIDLPSGDINSPILIYEMTAATTKKIAECNLEVIPESNEIILFYMKRDSIDGVELNFGHVQLDTMTITNRRFGGATADTDPENDDLTLTPIALETAKIGDAYYFTYHVTGRIRIMYVYESQADILSEPSVHDAAYIDFLFDPDGGSSELREEAYDPYASNAGKIRFNGEDHFAIIYGFDPIPGFQLDGHRLLVFDGTSVIHVFDNFYSGTVTPEIDGSEIYATGVSNVGARLFSDLYYNSSTDEWVQLNLKPDFPSINTGFRWVHSTDDVINSSLLQDWTIPSTTTIDMLLYQETDWVIASRNLSSSKLEIRRFPAAYPIQNLPPIMPVPTSVDSEFCGTEVAVNNDAIETEVTPSGLLLVTHFTCPSGLTADAEFTAVVVDTEFPDADLQVTMSDGVNEVGAGDQVIYTITATNTGPDDNNHVQILDAFPAPLSCSWTSVASGGASGNSDDTGDLLDDLMMPAGSSVTYTVTCATPVSSPTVQVINQVLISSPSVDLDELNNSASDEVTILDVDIIFIDGFEL